MKHELIIYFYIITNKSETSRIKQFFVFYLFYILKNSKKLVHYSWLKFVFIRGKK